MKEFKYDKLLSILQDNDSKNDEKTNTHKPKSDELEAAFNSYIDSSIIPSKTVLGIDIYRYSKYKELPQNLVPFVSDLLLDTVEAIIKENYFFQQYYKDNENYIRENFINTGDGGYFIFDTPLHAIEFAARFEMVIRMFNSYHLYPKLRNIIGIINLRYAMTYEKVYKYKKTFYGAGIITNARILSKDTLNRFLFDDNIYEWFLFNINGIENLQTLTLTDIKKINGFEEYDNSSYHSFLFSKDHKQHTQSILNINPVSAVDVQKIGEIKAKEDKLSIYNLHLQCSTTHYDNKFTISLGNLNVSGISD